MTYETSCEIIYQRILVLIPQHPEIKDFKNPWDLFKVPEFQCSDLNPTYAMVAIALAKAQNASRS